MIALQILAFRALRLAEGQRCQVGLQELRAKLVFSFAVRWCRLTSPPSCSAPHLGKSSRHISHYKIIFTAEFKQVFFYMAKIELLIKISRSLKFTFSVFKALWGKLYLWTWVTPIKFHWLTRVCQQTTQKLEKKSSKLKCSTFRNQVQKTLASCDVTTTLLTLLS